MLALVNGDYQPRGNGLRTVTGDAALLQRILLKLTVHRGQFPFGEEFGSRLWTLSQLRPSERQAAAEQYVVEALADEAGLKALAESGGTAKLTVCVSVNGTQMTVEAALQ